jgi:hypothetical protein
MNYVRSIVLLLLQLGSVEASFTQPNQLVRNIVDQTNIDSLITTVREFDGENSVMLNGALTRITDRQWGPDKPRPQIISYLNTRIAAYGFTAQQLRVWETAVSLLVEHQGTDPSLAPIIFCAHIDAGWDGTDTSKVFYTPAADDDASGVATVLEAIRILKRYKHRRTIIFALWDGEEFSCVGSGDYARTAKALGRKIEYVLNIDMIGYDANNDGVAHIYPAGTDAGSLAIRDTLFSVNTAYGLKLNLAAPKGSAPGGDALYFHLSGFSATLLMEDFYNDFNPNTHKNSDLSTKFNQQYYLKCAKLAIGSLAQLAEIEGEVMAVAPAATPKDFSLDQNYPNPFNPSTTISFSLPSQSFVTLKIFDAMGRDVATMINEELAAGNYARRWNASGLPSGVYFYRLQAGSFSETKHIMFVK